MTPEEVLRASQRILLVDWPAPTVPEALAKAGYEVIAAEGPEEYAVYELEGGAVVARSAGGPPEQADLVYSHRPTDELPDIVDWAQRLGARAVWCEKGSDEVRRIVESSGLYYVDDPPIAETARAVPPRS